MGLKKTEDNSEAKITLLYRHNSDCLYDCIGQTEPPSLHPVFTDSFRLFLKKKIAVLLLMPGNDFSTAGESKAQHPICWEHWKQNDDRKKQCQTISPVRLS